MPPHSSPFIVGLVIRFSGGLVKTKEQAYIVLLVFSALAFGISLLVFFGGSDRAEQQRMEAETVDA